MRLSWLGAALLTGVRQLHRWQGRSQGAALKLERLCDHGQADTWRAHLLSHVIVVSPLHR